MGSLQNVEAKIALYLVELFFKLEGCQRAYLDKLKLSIVTVKFIFTKGIYEEYIEEKQLSLRACLRFKKDSWAKKCKACGLKSVP